MEDTMNSGKWAVTLRCDSQEELEGRVALIVEYLAKSYQPGQWVISDIDATGRRGGSLTRHLDTEKTLPLSSAELLGILREDGQVIELDATLMQDNKALFRILIRDGISVDALGSGNSFPSSALGNYDEVDAEWFMWNIPAGT